MPYQMPPRIEQRKAMHYVAIAATVRRPDIGTQLPPLWPEIFAWLAGQGIAPAGAPFIRYLSMGSGDDMAVHVGIPVAASATGTARFQPGSFPAGRYAVLAHTGDYSGLHEANMAIHTWVGATGELFGVGSATPPAGHVHAEFYPTDPQQEPNPANWLSEVTLRLRD